MKRTFTKYPILASSSVQFDKVYNVVDYWGSAAGSDDIDEVIDAVEESFGYTVATPCTLKGACDVYHRYSNGDVDKAMKSIQSDYENESGVFPLSEYGSREQQKIYREYIRAYYPEEL
nr:MAG TPA: hypothetical protein [Caudoviricetes sp.]